MFMPPRRGRRMSSAFENRLNGGVILSTVAVALALDELDRMKAIECLPEPGALLDGIRRRHTDFDLLAGVAGAYLNERGLIGGCYE